MMIRNIELECKKICVLRCVNAIAYSVAFQYILLAVFLLFVNYSLFQPIAWIIDTVHLIFSFYTWLCLMPLIIFIVIYGFLLAHFYFAENVYHATRFAYILKTSVAIGLFGLIHVLIGFLTGWVYVKFLSNEYGQFQVKCFNESCINERYTFLILNGIYASLYYFFKERLQRTKTIDFPVIQQGIYTKIRSNIYDILYRSFMGSFIPALSFIVGYYINGSFIRPYISGLFGRQIDNNISLFDVRLIFYIWLISSQILSNMRLMDFLFTTFLTERKEFPIAQPMPTVQHSELILTEALSCVKVPIVQELAGLDLYTLANHTDPKRRIQLFALSIPGGHPYNWRAISDQCLNIIDTYTETLLKSTEILIPGYRQSVEVGESQFNKPSATEMAEKILFRQYNENFGIRNLIFEPTEVNQTDAAKVTTTTTTATLNAAYNDAIGLVSIKYQSLKSAFMRIPLINFLFAESLTGYVCYLLKRSHFIGWICQGMATLAAHSLSEDKYGVVQDDLNRIIKSLLKLKQCLDKICTVNLGGKCDQNKCIALRNTVRRSIYNISTVFAEYIPDIITDPNDLRTIQCFIYYKEV